MSLIKVKLDRISPIVIIDWYVVEIKKTVIWIIRRRSRWRWKISEKTWNYAISVISVNLSLWRRCREKSLSMSAPVYRGTIFTPIRAVAAWASA